MKAPKSYIKMQGGWWAEHYEHKLVDWKYAINNNDTRLGYWDWVYTLVREGENQEEETA